MSEHTPTPWTLVKSVDGLITIDAIHYPEGITAIADLTFNGRAARNNQVEANAAYIVQAANAHDALVAALERFGMHSFTCQAQLNWRDADDLAADDPACDCDLAETIRMARGEVPS